MLQSILVLHDKHAHRLLFLKIFHLDWVAAGVQDLAPRTVRQIVDFVPFSLLILLLKACGRKGAVPGERYLVFGWVEEGKKAVSRNGVVLFPSSLLNRCLTEVCRGGYHARPAPLRKLIPSDPIDHAVPQRLKGWLFCLEPAGIDIGDIVCLHVHLLHLLLCAHRSAVKCLNHKLSPSPFTSAPAHWPPSSAGRRRV